MGAPSSRCLLERLSRSSFPPPCPASPVHRGHGGAPSFPPPRLPTHASRTSRRALSHEVHARVRPSRANCRRGLHSGCSPSPCVIPAREPDPFSPPPSYFVPPLSNSRARAPRRRSPSARRTTKPSLSRSPGLPPRARAATRVVPCPLDRPLAAGSAAPPGPSRGQGPFRPVFTGLRPLAPSRERGAWDARRAVPRARRRGCFSPLWRGEELVRVRGQAGVFSHSLRRSSDGGRAAADRRLSPPLSLPCGEGGKRTVMTIRARSLR